HPEFTLDEANTKKFLGFFHFMKRPPPRSGRGGQFLENILGYWACRVALTAPTPRSDARGEGQPRPTQRHRRRQRYQHLLGRAVGGDPAAVVAVDPQHMGGTVKAVLARGAVHALVHE